MGFPRYLLELRWSAIREYLTDTGIDTIYLHVC